MTVLNFPDPTVTTTYIANGKFWNWNGESWVSSSTGSGVASVAISDTAPVNPNSGDLWWNSVYGQLKIYYNDSDTGQWVDANAGAVGPTGFTGSIGFTGSQGDIGFTGSAGAGGSVAVEDEGTEVVSSASRINFVGSGVSVADAGSGEVTVTIAGSSGSVEDEYSRTLAYLAL